MVADIAKDVEWLNMETYTVVSGYNCVVDVLADWRNLYTWSTPAFFQFINGDLTADWSPEANWEEGYYMTTFSIHAITFLLSFLDFFVEGFNMSAIQEAPRVGFAYYRSVVANSY